jgi:hypothetical protein
LLGSTRVWVAGVFAAAFVLVGSSCGPSMQSIYEGNIRFEHCYRLDLDNSIAPSHRQACWNEWLTAYSYGQTRDRIEYARRRLRSIASGDADRPRLMLDIGYRPEERQFYLSAPTPTSAHAPPPSIVREEPRVGAANDAKEKSPDEVMPGDDCVLSCRAGRKQCARRCSPDAGDTADTGTKPKSPTSAPEPGTACECDEDYAACVRRCFEGDKLTPPGPKG